MRVFGRRTSHTLVANNTDRVLVSYPLPSGGRLNNIHLNCHVIGPEGLELHQVVMYGITGFVVPVADPDTSVTMDVLWDSLITKDEDPAAGSFDLDTAAADVTPEFEMGEVDWSGVFQLESQNPVEIFRRRRMLSVVDGMVNYEVVSAAADLWVPGEKFTSKIGRRVSVQTPSVVMLGFSSPNLDDTTGTVSSIPTEIQWILLQYLELTLEQAFMHLIGLVEAGAETPYVESADFLASLLEDDAFEDTAGAFSTVAFNVFTQATFDITVPGHRMGGTISSE